MHSERKPSLEPCVPQTVVRIEVIVIIMETIATLPGGWDLAHAIRLGIKLFAELGANSQALSGSHVDSPCSCRAIFESAPVAMLQSLIMQAFTWLGTYLKLLGLFVTPHLDDLAWLNAAQNRDQPLLALLLSCHV